jgi:hypothetical protein
MEKYVPSATVVSLVPFVIDEMKPGMQPSKFRIEAAPLGGMITLLIHKCQHGVYLDEHRPVLVVPTAPEEVAEAICLDYKKGQLGLVMGEAEPGLFWVPGDYDGKYDQIKSVFAADYSEAEKKQYLWFRNIVAKADDAWNKFHQRGMISAMERLAATHLKLERDWLLDAEITRGFSECPSCFEKVNPKAIICRHCGFVINEEEHKKRKFVQTATVGK